MNENKTNTSKNLKVNFENIIHKRRKYFLEYWRSKTAATFIFPNFLLQSRIIGIEAIQSSLDLLPSSSFTDNN